MLFAKLDFDPLTLKSQNKIVSENSSFTDTIVIGTNHKFDIKTHKTIFIFQFNKVI